MKLLSVLGLAIFAPIVFGAIIIPRELEMDGTFQQQPKPNRTDGRLDTDNLLTKPPINSDVNNTRQQEAVMLEAALQIIDAAVKEYTQLNNIDNGPTTLDEYYTYLLSTQFNYRYDPSASYAKQIVDVLREILEKILIKDPMFLGTLISPTAENLRNAVNAVVEVLTEPITF